MALKGYLIERYNNMTGSYTCYRLIEEANLLGIDLRLIGVEDSIVQHGILYNKGEQLFNCDFVINRYKTGQLKEQINGLAKRTYNCTNLFDGYINKFEQVSKIKGADFALPRYILGMSSLNYDTILSSVGGPFVAKGLESSMGREIYLVTCNAEFEALRSNYGAEKEWLFEEFIESSWGKDLRVFSIRGNAIAAMVRKSAVDFRANVALGAEVESVPIDETISRISKEIYEQTKLDFVGIDLLFGENKYYFCEVNVMPGLQGIETASGINIAKEVMMTIKNDFCNE